MTERMNKELVKLRCIKAADLLTENPKELWVDPLDRGRLVPIDAYYFDGFKVCCEYKLDGYTSVKKFTPDSLVVVPDYTSITSST